MASAIARAYNGSLGQSPQRGSGAEPLVRGSRGRSPSEAEELLVYGRLIETANLPIFYNLETQRNDIFVLSLQTSNLSKAHETRDSFSSSFSQIVMVYL